MSAVKPLPAPVDSDLRHATRVDYFETLEDAQLFHDHLMAQERTGNPTQPRGPVPEGRFAGLYGVLWNDRPGYGWYS